MDAFTEKADKAYEKWLKKKDSPAYIDAKIVAGWIKNSGLEMATIGGTCGVSERSLGRITSEGQKKVLAENALQIAYATGFEDECEELLRFEPPGQEGWSTTSTHCVDCGTWWHPHYRQNRCETCYDAWFAGSKQSQKRLRQGDVPISGVLRRKHTGLV